MLVPFIRFSQILMLVIEGRIVIHRLIFFPDLVLTISLQAITFHRCKYLNVKNLLVVNSQQMHMAFTKCRRVAASNLKVVAPAHSPNTDGIHISASKGVVVKDSIIRTGWLSVKTVPTKLNLNCE